MATSGCGYSYYWCTTGNMFYSQRFEEFPEELTLENCKWLEELVKVTKDSPNNRPSEDHFLVVLWGKKLGIFNCKTDRYGSRNPGTLIPLEAWWTDRWPTHEESAIMKKTFGDFGVGRPPDIHLHGN